MLYIIPRNPLCATLSLLLLASAAAAQVPLQQLGTDTYNNPQSFHATEIEPDSFSVGSTIVATYQVGRAAKGGASDTGFATSLDGGQTWTTGNLPGITRADNPDNPYDRANDPAVTYDAKHGVWMIVTMPWAAAQDSAPPRPPVPIPAAIVSRSVDGLNWDNPISATPDVLNSDKPWIACDNTPTSPFYGNCYVEWDIPRENGLIQMNASTDGGLTWGPTMSSADSAGGIGGIPMVRPDGTVIVPFYRFKPTSIAYFTSIDGGLTWSTTQKISKLVFHVEAGNFRTIAEPSGGMDANGNIYIAWQDCRFRLNCASNDIVLSQTADGVTWSKPFRIPIDDGQTIVDYFLPGLAIDPTTSGDSVHMALTYYYFSDTNCDATSCRLYVGAVSSADSGVTWSAPVQLAGPMRLSWLPTKNKKPMVADYISTSYANGLAFGFFPVATKKVDKAYNMAVFTNAVGMAPPVHTPGLAGAHPGPAWQLALDYELDDQFTILGENNLLFPDLDTPSIDTFHDPNAEVVAY